MKKTTDFRKTSIVVKNGRLALLALPVSHHCLVSRFGCHIVCQLSAADFKHPCLKLWASIIAHPCAFMNALMALRPCKAFGRSFYKASMPYPHGACSPTRRTKNNNPTR